MATFLRPVAIVSPMKKARKPKKKTGNKKSPRKSIKNFTSPCSQNSLYFAESPVSISDTSSSENNVLPLLKINDKSQMFNIERQGRLCDMFNRLGIRGGSSLKEPKVRIGSGRIPEHDKKILERMASKMKKDLIDIEIAHHAHILWENERQERERLQQNHAAEYNLYIREKRKEEKEMNELKFEEVRQIYDWEKKLLRARLDTKENAAISRIRALEYFKNNEIDRKHEVAREKAENALVILKERKLEEMLWRRSLAEVLNQKTSNAEMNREIIMRLHKQRTAIDNRIHEENQKQNWREQRMVEMENLAQLKKQVDEKSRKMIRIQKEREKFVRESRRQASCTARMRENLKRSLSPDVFMRCAVQNHRPTFRQAPRVCLTPNSYESHIRLG